MGTRIMFETITWIAFFASVFGVIYIYLNARHKERMSLIEKGVDANLFYSEKQDFNWSKFFSKFTLKIGMFLMGIALGLFIGALLLKINFIDNDAVIYPSSIFFFGGLSLLLYYIIMDRKSK